MTVPDPQNGRPLGPWHRHFCLAPIETYDGRTVWLRKVWRRGCISRPDIWDRTHTFFQHSIESPFNDPR